MILTIGVPTFNRFSEITQFIKSWLEFPTSLQIELLISDNCSTSYDFKDLYIYSSGENKIKIIRTPKNLGLTGNILNIFKHSRGDFTLLCSDEDRIVSAENIRSLIKILSKTDGFYFSTSFQRCNLGRTYNYTGRGKTREIIINDFHASNFYLSGGVYRTKDSFEILKRVFQKREEYVCAYLYPHSLITAEFLITKKKCYWVNIPVTKEGVNLKPISSMPDKRAYNHISSRYEQFVSFIDYFESLKISSDGQFYVNKKRLIRSHKNNFILWLRWGLATTNEDLIDDFDSGLLRTYRQIATQKLRRLISPRERFLNSIINVSTRATWMLTKYNGNGK
jgi:glycosyltransferase involved in cell wall biosynthesis